MNLKFSLGEIRAKADAVVARCVVTNAGTTNTGTTNAGPVDPLNDVADSCAPEELGAAILDVVGRVS